MTEKIALIAGVGGVRENAIAWKLKQNGAELFTSARTLNPGIDSLSSKYDVRLETDVEGIANWVSQFKPDYAFVGSEQPLVAGIVDKLAEFGIPSVGPSRDAAQIEGSKLFLRKLMTKYEIPGNIEYHHVTDLNQHKRILEDTGHEFALKPIGLTGGKGVKVMGVHLTSIGEAVEYGNQIIADEIGGKEGFLLEERLVGSEFTLQAFTDGTTVIPMPLVRDYKKAFEGDLGPNTGSMGSYSHESGMLPFINLQDIVEASLITKSIVDALKNEGRPFKGILYSQFMKTKEGLKVVEENCRFGDPEAVDVLLRLKTSLAIISKATISESLKDLEVEFENKATVVRYITPPGYPDSPESGVLIDMDEAAIKRAGGQLFYGQVKPTIGGVLTTGSRTAAIAAVGSTISDAERKVTNSMHGVKGRYHVRNDIGREELLAKDRV